MQCCTELIPPSGVTDALALPFVSADAKNLILARTSVLQVFDLKQKNHGQDIKLVLVAEYSLSGTVTSLGRVRILNSRSGGEAILIAFRDAKLSLIEWDPEKYSISTISIHYYESEGLRRNPWVPDLRDCINHLTVDPSSRCAVFHFGMTNVAVIPFHQLGDDLVMDDYGAESGPEDANRSPTKILGGDVASHQTPYASSFVLPLTALDPGILHPLHLAFLYEYREPTFGILYSSLARSSALNYERKDAVQYAVFTLDLEQRASTILLSVLRLPNDLFAVIALPLPVGGALLVGTNEMIHVDQGGKTNAIGVNEFARQYSAFPMADQSKNRMRLEGSQIEQLNASNGDMLIVLANGDLAVLSFRLDGRSISGMSLCVLPQELSRSLFQSKSSCIAFVEPCSLFLGSDVADSVLLSSARKVSQLKKRSSRSAQQYVGDGLVDTAGDDLDKEQEEEKEEEEEEEDDDLYGDAVEGNITGPSEGTTAAGSNLRVLDRLQCIAPLKDVTVGRVGKRTRDGDEPGREGSMTELHLVASSGEGCASGITIFNRELQHEVIRKTKTSRANGVWSFSVKPTATSSDDLGVNRNYDEFLILSKHEDTGHAESVLYGVSEQLLQEKTGTDFDPSAGGTVECGSITDGAHTVQVLEAEIRVYDQDFGLAQIWPLVDEETKAEAKAVSASFADPYVLIVKEDHSILLLKTDKKGELDELDLGPHQLNDEHISASLYSDRQGVFNGQGLSGMLNEAKVVCYMATLSLGGALSIYSLSDLKTRLFYYEGANFLPSTMLHDTPLPRHWKDAEPLSDLLIADLGDKNETQPYLVLRTSSGEVAIYTPFTWRSTDASQHTQPILAFRKNPLCRIAETASDVSKPEAKSLSKKWRSMKTAPISGLFAILVPGLSPAMIAKTATSSPRLLNFSIDGILAFSGHHTATCSQGFVYLDVHDNLCMARLPSDISIGHSDWVQRKVELGLNVSGVAYLERTRSYVLATSSLVDFQLPQDDEWHADWKDEDVNLLPQIEQGSMKLLSSTSFSIIDSFQLDHAERPMCIKCMNLEVSEETHERKDLIVVGTANTKGEDVVARGAIYIFDVVDVVPEPGVPETDLKLKLIAKEEVKGAVTSLSRIGSQGFMLASQGQKCMVRGLKEDLSILPVAFMDMKYYVSVAKELAGTGLCILGDAMNGLWFVGYSEEPYKLQLFGRDQFGIEVTAADFLPDGKNLYLVVADGDGRLHVMQFDPDSPESERGTKLLHRSTFASGCFISTMTLLPSSGAGSVDKERGSERSSHLSSAAVTPRRQILFTSQEGSVGLITPLPEQVYRRLLALQNILTANLEHACGLNPRAYRAVETDGIGGAAMVDGALVRRWLDQDRFHQSLMADKVGSTVWEVREDVNEISGGSLFHL